MVPETWQGPGRDLIGALQGPGKAQETRRGSNGILTGLWHSPDLIEACLGPGSCLAGS